ncbi:MAG: hypothetical protein JXA78_05000 [Anaerolineales bacterium]|nr:hypothetical protein [Anaerolineales bacterium]
MKILVLHHGLYGQRIADNLRARGPGGWQVNELALPRVLPPIVDEPEEFLPPGLPDADLVLHLAETPQAAQLLGEVVRRSGARAVIAPVDFPVIPEGLRRQLSVELAALGAGILFPEPFCSLCEAQIDGEAGLQPTARELLVAFTHHFGRPRLRLERSADGACLAQVIVERGAPCGSSHYAAGRLRGLPLSQATPQAGLFCHHYPCLASMQPMMGDDGVETLMVLSGRILNEAMQEALQAFR